MPSRKSLTDAAIRPAVDQPSGRPLAWAFLAGTFAAVAILALAQPPPALVLPALSALLVASGFGLAATSYAIGSRQRDGMGNYELAGALVFIGFAAALLTDSEQALALFERMEAQGLAALTK